MKWGKVYDPQLMEDTGQRLSTTVDIAFRLSKGRSLTFLLAAGLVVFIWQQFLALLIGGAFYRLMAGMQPRVWTGVIVFFSIPPLVRMGFMVYSTLSVTVLKVRDSTHASQGSWTADEGGELEKIAEKRLIYQLGVASRR